MSFATLKKSSSSSLDTLNAAIAKYGSKFVDKHEGKWWVPTKDKAGGGGAIIRFLPTPDGEDAPFVLLHNHSFQGTSGKWFVGNCPTTIGKECPVCDANSALWATKIKANEDIARDRARRKKYLANVYIVSDPRNKDAEGKVFVYKFGQKVMDKILKISSGEKVFEDEVKFDPFNMWTGANLRLVLVPTKNGPNYDESKFETQSALSKDEAKLEEIYNSMHSLKQFIAESEFDSHDNMAERFNRIMNAPAMAKAADTTLDSTVDDATDVVVVGNAFVPPEKTAEKVEAPTSDDDDEFIKKLLAGDGSQ